ncbi:MAG: polymerase sigma-70 factor, subfamily [Gammaproteobacteria bacterium]|jgi:RNA polymerase sigma factor (sigma-70 family)|nr:polymerase sigma-70 factor, subfamily [Gammaproteobacteria bacterium]
MAPKTHTHFSIQTALYYQWTPLTRKGRQSVPISDRQRFLSAMATQYGQRLRRFLSLRLRNVHDVPDLAQEVFLRLLRVDRHETIRNPEAYLFTVASHVIHQHALRGSSEPISVEITEALAELQAPDNDDPTYRAERTQRIEAFEATIAELPPRVAAALVLQRIGGYTVQEIADRLGVSRETAKKYLARAAQHCHSRHMAAE